MRVVGAAGLLQATSGSPLRAAVSFGVSASTLTFVVVALEGRLIDAEPGVQPFIRNISTIIDFAFLDPLMIWAFLSAVRSIRRMGINLPGWPIVVSVLAGFSVMAGYYARVISKGFSDALIIVHPAHVEITATGWVVFSFTAILISIVFYSLFAQYFYVRHISRLGQSDIPYQPFHEDGCAGVRSLAAPAWYTLNGLLLLLVVFTLFQVQDVYINEHPASWRLLAGFPAYIAIAPLVFMLPVDRLRQLMLGHRARLISTIDRSYDSLQLDRISMPPADAADVEAKIAALVRLRTTVSAFPTWPLPLLQLVQAVAYCISPLGTVFEFGPEVVKHLAGR